MIDQVKPTSNVLADGTVYSARKDHRPFTSSSLEDYASIMGPEKIERVQKIAHRLKGLKLLELNATAQGGGVAEMLFSEFFRGGEHAKIKRTFS